MDVVYVAVAMLIVPALLLFVARLGRRPDLGEPFGRLPPESIGDEAERWLRSQR